MMSVQGFVADLLQSSPIGNFGPEAVIPELCNERPLRAHFSHWFGEAINLRSIFIAPTMSSPLLFFHLNGLAKCLPPISASGLCHFTLLDNNDLPGAATNPKFLAACVFRLGQ
jgi:hypothetical protein